MIELARCPACSGEALDAVALPVDAADPRLAAFAHVLIADSDFALCRRCELLFARRRQGPEEREAYYRAFPEVEGRAYADVYPPPDDFLRAQTDFSEYLVGVLDRAGLLRPGQRVLNLRCEFGAHLDRLRRLHGAGELYGLDHFESNLRYAREVFGLTHLALLDPFELSIPFDPPHYDLVLANHLLTHALEPMALLARLRELVAPGGALVLYNEIDHLPVLRRRKRYARGYNNYHKQLLTRRSVVNVCALAGLEARLLSCEAKGRRWAASGHSMVLLARPCEPLAPDALPPGEPDETHAAVRTGRRAHRSGRWLDAARGALGRVARRA